MTSPSLKTRTNQDWLRDLRKPPQAEALEELRSLLVRGLRASLAGRVDADLDALSEDYAQEALLKILSGLETFRGESKFTTWAQKIAIHVALSDLRRKRWRDIPLQQFTQTPEGEEFTPAILADRNNSTEDEAARRDLLRSLERLIFQELTERQRTALLSIIQDGLPLAEVAERLHTNPNALYKLLHDARQHLKERLEAEEDITAQEALSLFENRAT